MIRKLKRRIILLVLAGLLLASAGVVVAINVMNWHSLEAQAGAVLDMLAENGGVRPQSEFGEPDRGNRQWTGTPPPAPEGTSPDAMEKREPPEGARDMNAGQRGRSRELLNAANLSNFYTVQLDGEGSITGWYSDRTDLYTDEDVAETTAAARASGKETGRVGTQFFRWAQEGRMLIVVDQRLEIQNAQNVLRLTALVAVIEDAVLSIGAVWLIRRMVKPVDEAMEKQKQFVWDASHELKTPLAVISANAQVLSEEAGPSKPLEYIQSEVERSDQLIQSLLTLARMEKGTVTARHEKFDLSRAVMEVALPFETALFEAGKRMEMDVPDGIFFTGDAGMMKQLTVILLSNAQKYSDDHGQVRLSLEARGDKRILKVHNTGPAIPPEAQQRIFDRFYRVDSSHNREIEGNGLGLAIAQSIVAAHRGRITVHSAAGEGTTFTVTV